MVHKISWFGENFTNQKLIIYFKKFAVKYDIIVTLGRTLLYFTNISFQSAKTIYI